MSFGGCRPPERAGGEAMQGRKALPTALLRIVGGNPQSNGARRTQDIIEELKNDTVAYIAVSATSFVRPRWQVHLQGAWLGLFEVLAFLYNIILFSIVHTRSPSVSAFGGNINKAALIFFTLVISWLRMHEIPHFPYRLLIWFAVVISISAFCAYGKLQLDAKQEEQQKSSSCGSLGLALAGVLGETKLNVDDTVVYMAVSATSCLLQIAMSRQKEVPGEWSTVSGKNMMTDYEILSSVWGLKKYTGAWAVLSGGLSFLYNNIRFAFVHTLAPAVTAFGGNINESALIFFTLLIPWLRVHELPQFPYREVIWLAVIFSIAAVSAYGKRQLDAKQASKELQKLMRVECEGDCEDGSNEERSGYSGPRR